MADRRPRFQPPTRRLARTKVERSAGPAPEVLMEAHPEDVAAPVEESVVDAAIYRDGHRIDTPKTVAEAARRLRAEPGTMAWIGLFRPNEAQLLPMADGFGLADILTVNATLVNQAQNDEIKRLTEASYDQNEEVKRVSAWAAIIFAPTLIGTIYGMNFQAMPELAWAYGYPFALGLMLVVSVGLWLIFRARGWL